MQPVSEDEYANLYHQGFARVAACSIRTTPADPAANLDAVLEQAQACHDEGVAVAVFSELSLSGYAIDDLLLQSALLDAVEDAVGELLRRSADLRPLLLVGAPVRFGLRLYNCALAVQGGRLLGVVPKQYLPGYRNFYEPRHFAAGVGTEGGEVTVAGHTAPFGPDQLFAVDDVPGLVVHTEICEDVWVPVPPSSLAALAGATVLTNLSASNITIGKADTRQALCRSQSLRCAAAYVYAAAGDGESTTDLAWDGQVEVHEMGRVLAEGARFADVAQRAVADVDLQVIAQERMRTGSMDDARRAHDVQAAGYRTTHLTLDPPTGDLGLLRTVPRFPFVPDDPSRLDSDCYEAYSIQVSALVQRLRATGISRPVIGVSGGLDSTHALIICARAMDLLGLPRSNVLAFTMPGFATSEGTRTAAHALMTAVGATAAELDIKPLALQMLADLGHPFAAGEPVHDVTFENVQAGLRYDLLFRIANSRAGMVVGTGDLSELALGWATYGVGDHMSHYAVNCGVPKTLIQHLIRWVVRSEQFDRATCEVLQTVLDTEISPELVPVAPGEKPQSTQAMIGPYELQDFTLFHLLRYGLPPSRIVFMAEQAWRDAGAGEWPPHHPEAERRQYTRAEIVGWTELFLRRFFAHQFKRSAIPNGPKVTDGGSLSPRGDWRMPSDARATAWLAELAAGVPPQS